MNNFIRIWAAGTLLALLLMAVFGFINMTETFPGAESSGQQTASTAISAQQGFVSGVRLVNTSGATTATLLLYDNATTASGTILSKYVVAASSAVYDGFGLPVRYSKGIYGKLTAGTVGTATYFVDYTNR